MPRVSKVQRLNEDDKAWLDDLLIARGFSGYAELEQLCRERGVDISSSAIHRYGQSFQERLEAVRLVTEQARAVVEHAPDEEGAVNDALMRIVQEKLFTILVDTELDTDNLPKLARAIADLGRAAVNQKKMAAEVRKQVLTEAAANAEASARKQGVSKDGVAALRAAIMGQLA